MVIWKIFGVIGLLFIIAGVLLHKRKRQDELYVLGGLFLLSYSISIKDWIFIILQVVFTLVAGYDLLHRKRKSKKHNK
ncbi:hypothetical protein GOV10_01355 [Candidatus Woesearchaeota archaeon]|nr:hypothetical protein [Candidatus Woesearchaeota archaeon]